MPLLWAHIRGCRGTKMVKSRLLIGIVIAAFILVALVGMAIAQQIQYHLGYEYAEVWINSDGSIDLLYNMSVTCDSGVIHWVKVGQPNSEFTITGAQDESGQSLGTTSTGDGVQIDVQDISSGQTSRFSLLTKVARMIYEDTQNPGNVGMQFIPTWYDANILDLRVLIVLPEGVTWQNVRTSVNWDNNITEGGRLAIYWERTNLAPNQQYTFGVSFPKQYVPDYQPPSQPPPETQPWTPPQGTHSYYQPGVTGATVFFAIFFLAAIIGIVAIVARKLPYIAPSVSMETLGIRHGLTAVEASYLLDVKPTKIVTEILYSLLQKRAIWVESTTPSLKLKILQPFQDKTGTLETPLRYYEIDFLETVKEDGTLDEEKLAHTVMFLRDTVEEKMRGYCRRDTIDYYRKIVAKAWEQVEQAGTPELASKAYDEQLLWLLLNPDFQSRTQTAFRDRAFEPSPIWLWYWYGYQHYHPNPTYKPNIETFPQRVEAPTKAVEIPTQMATPSTQEAKPPTIPGADFANNIATAVENTSNNIVANLEKFANAIVPMPAAAEKVSNQPAHHASSCVCACVSCACVCACVSCACACASGGVG